MTHDHLDEGQGDTALGVVGDWDRYQLHDLPIAAVVFGNAMLAATDGEMVKK